MIRKTIEYNVEITYEILNNRFRTRSKKLNLTIENTVIQTYLEKNVVDRNGHI